MKYYCCEMCAFLPFLGKNAILIVQFSKGRVESDRGLLEAILKASELRLRPIVMTSLAFDYGVLPVALANGIGAGTQKAVGTAVVGRVVISTLCWSPFFPLSFMC